MHYISVEKGSNNITDYLIQQGYNIEEFYEDIGSTLKSLHKV